MDDDWGYGGTPYFRKPPYTCIYIVRWASKPTYNCGGITLSIRIWIFNERLQVETSTIDWILWGINDQSPASAITTQQPKPVTLQPRLRNNCTATFRFLSLQKGSTTTMMITSSQYSMFFEYLATSYLSVLVRQAYSHEIHQLPIRASFRHHRRLHHSGRWCPEREGRDRPWRYHRQNWIWCHFSTWIQVCIAGFLSPRIW